MSLMPRYRSNKLIVSAERMHKLAIVVKLPHMNLSIFHRGYKILKVLENQAVSDLAFIDIYVFVSME